MALRRTLSTRGASVLAALVFAGILTAMAGLMSGIGPREPVVATSQGAVAAAATAPGASANGVGQATDIEQTCKIGEDYDITSKDGKPAVVAYTPCPVGNNTRPPPDIPKTEGINTHNFGKCINPRPADYAKNVWTCAVRDCFKAPINSAMNGSISGGSNTIYCRFTTLEIGAAANAKSVREKTIVGTKEISSAAQQQALKNDGIVSTTIDSGAQNGITGEPSPEQQSEKEALQLQ